MTHTYKHTQSHTKKNKQSRTHTHHTIPQTIACTRTLTSFGTIADEPAGVVPRHCQGHCLGQRQPTRVSLGEPTQLGEVVQLLLILHVPWYPSAHECFPELRPLSELESDSHRLFAHDCMLSDVRAVNARQFPACCHEWKHN